MIIKNVIVLHCHVLSSLLQTTGKTQQEEVSPRRHCQDKVIRGSKI